jgi:hypothetical protein
MASMRQRVDLILTAVGDLIFTKHLALASAMRRSDEWCAETPHRVAAGSSCLSAATGLLRKISKLCPSVVILDRCMHHVASLASSGENRQTSRRRC